MTLQEFIHKVELGSGARTLRNVLIGLAVLTLVLMFNWRCYHNMSTQEAMDSAQVARNVAEGRGFTTLFLRPFSLDLVEQRSEAKYGPVPQEPHKDYMQVQGRHPDLANPPLYPCVLAAWMKTYPVVFKVMNGITSIMPGSISRRLPTWNDDPANPFWQSSSHVWWWPADFCIAMLNEGFFFVVIVLVFVLARRLFDLEVAWVSAVLLLGSELLWRFGVSGLSTMLLMVMVMGLAWCMMCLERETREPKWGPLALLWLPAASGLLIGAMAMTRYSLACLIIPAVLFMVWYGGQRRVAMCVIAVVVFVVTCSPWIARNISVSGTPFGTAGYTIMDGTSRFPDYQLERSLKPDMNFYVTKVVGRKLLANLRDIAVDELPRLGGSWVMPFFLLGLMLGFRSTALIRLRNFIVTCLITLSVAQALGRTELSVDSPDVNSENLLVLFTPLVIIYGVSLFFVLLNQMKFRRPNRRLWAIGLFGVMIWLPLAGEVCPPRNPPVSLPYWLPTLQDIGGMMNERELVMSDVPWAVAWYGDRQCVWLSLNSMDDFFAINDYIKPIQAVYLSSLTMDGRFVTQWVRTPASWGLFALQCMERKENMPPFPPPTYPLHAVWKNVMPEQFFISDWDRWKAKSSTNAVASP